MGGGGPPRLVGDPGQCVTLHGHSDDVWFRVMPDTQTCINYLIIQMILMQDSENMIRHHQNGYGVSHTAQGGSPTRRGGLDSIAVPQPRIAALLPCHQCTPAIFLGLINTCGNRNAPGG